MAIDLEYLLAPVVSSPTVQVPKTERCGVRRPFQRDLKQDIANVCGEALIRANIGQILGTKAQGRVSNGETPWRPEFGSRLEGLRFRNLGPALDELARVHIVDALELWEPRVEVTETLIESLDNNKLSIKLRVNFRSNRRSTGSYIVKGLLVEVEI